MSWFPANFYSRNSQKHESELATFDQPIKLKHTSVINVRVSPIFAKQEELISRAGSFCGFGKVGARICWKWIRWRSKVELKVFRWKFQEIYRIDSPVLELFDVSLEFLSLGSSRQFAMIFGPKMRKRISVSRFPCFFFSFYRISFQKFWNFQWISGDDFSNSVTHLDW